MCVSEDAEFGQETSAPSASLRQPQLGIEGENKGSVVSFAFFKFTQYLFLPQELQDMVFTMPRRHDRARCDEAPGVHHKPEKVRSQELPDRFSQRSIV